MDFQQIVIEMKEEEKTLSEKQIIDIINSASTFTEKCILAKKYLSPQSTIMEQIIKTDLNMGKKKNQTSGDATKNGSNYEIKYSGHAKKSKWNFVQIRPDHDVQFYLLLGYNMYDESNTNIGKAYIFKVPSLDMYNLVKNYGGYAHGTIDVLGKLSTSNIKGRNCEYALRCDPNAKKGKNKKIFDELKKYEVDYLESNF